jgi:hypothetical protein
MGTATTFLAAIPVFSSEVPHSEISVQQDIPDLGRGDLFGDG